MAVSSNPPSFSTFDPLQVSPSEALLLGTPLPGGGLATAGITHTTGTYLDLPGFDEHLVFVHFRHHMHVDLRIDQDYAADNEKGDIIIVPRGHPTHWHTAGTAEALILALPNSQLMTTALQAADAARTDWELLPRVGTRDPLIHAVGSAIYDHLQGGGLLGELYLETLLLTLTVRLVREHVVFPVRVPSPYGYLSPTMLRCVTDYIESNLDQQLSLSSLALLVQYSPFHFARCFRNSTGQPLHQYVLVRRLERAKYLLETTDLAIAEVAQAAGFSNHSQLAGHFRRRYNVTPHQYRSRTKRGPSFGMPARFA